MGVEHYPFINSIVIVFFLSIFILFFFSKKVRLSNTWKATITPLASIIGSGFLIATPLFVLILGKYAVFAIVGVVGIAYLMGYVMRFNIYHVEPQIIMQKTKTITVKLEYFSYAILGIAYLISVPFYIKLLSLFVLRGFNEKNEFISNCIATALLAFIGLFGKFRGFKKLESLEEYSVNIKLAVIGAMLVSFIIYNVHLLSIDTWQLAISTPAFDVDTIRKLLGTIIIVQGFETSRFLGLTYDQKMRVNTMRNAQIISGIIYVLFVGLSLVVFDHVSSISETAIVDITQKVAVVLPYILIAAAVFSQFGAAIADTIGAGGLLSEATMGRLYPETNYLLIAGIAIALTWMTNIFEIITLASRAFAAYYAIQALEAMILSYRQISNFRSRLKTILFLVIFFIMLMIVLFGIPI